MTTISVNFDNPTKTYSPGQAVSGTVHVENKTNLSARGITVTAYGYCKVKWTEGSGENETSHSNEEKYYNLESLLWGNGSSSSDLSKGNHTFTFNFILPHNIPSTTEAKHGKVVHEIKANIDIPWRIDKKAIVPYKVQTTLDLNKDPKAKDPIRLNDEKYVCCLCCRSGPISAVLRIDRSGYLPGEKILINAECTNMTERTVKATAKLVKVTKFHSKGKKEKKHREIVSQEMSHPAIVHGDTDFWQAQALLIPEHLEPSYLEHCQIMDINYFLELELKISKTTKNLCVSSEIIIGTYVMDGTNNNSDSSIPQGVVLNPNLLPNTGYGFTSNLSAPITAPPTSSSHLPAVESQYGFGAPQQYGMGTQNSNTSAFTWS